MAVGVTKMTKAEFLEKWQACTRCALHQTAKNHVVYRGSIPAKVLFIGEAPDHVEDKLGKPFVGPSGQILTTTIDRIQLKSFCIANVVCCIPLQHGADKIRQPSHAEVYSCRSHLTDLLAICKPKLVISLGEIAKRHLVPLAIAKNYPDVTLVHLRHPAYVLRMGGKDSLEHKKMILGLQDACTNAGIKHTTYLKLAMYRDDT